MFLANGSVFCFGYLAADALYFINCKAHIIPFPRIYICKEIHDFSQEFIHVNIPETKRHHLEKFSSTMLIGYAGAEQIACHRAELPTMQMPRGETAAKMRNPKMVDAARLENTIYFTYRAVVIATMLEKMFTQNFINGIIFKRPRKRRQINLQIRVAAYIDIQIPFTLAIAAT